MKESDDVGEKYVMSLDVGTTTIRSMVYNKGGVVMGTAATPVRYFQVSRIKIRQSKLTDEKRQEPYGLQQRRGSYG